MAKIKLNGDTSGYIEISAPAVSGNNTLELGPGTKILTNLDNTFTGVSTFSNGLNVTGGNVLVGTTDATIYNNGDSDSEGIVLRDGEVIDIARKGDLQLTLNRQTNDGPHIGFFRSGSPKTYISTRNDAFCIDTGGLNERLRITSDGKLIHGVSSSSYDLTTAGNGYRGLLIGSTSGSTSALLLDGASNGDGTGSDYGSIEHNSGGEMRYKNRQTSGSGGAGHVFYTTNSDTERLRITSAGYVGINDSAPEVRFHVRENTGDGSSRTLAMFQKNHTSTSLSGNMASNGYPHALILENQDTSSDQGLSSLCFSKYTSGSQSQGVIAGISESAGNMALTFNTESSNTVGERLRIGSEGNLALGGQNTSAYSGHTNLFLGGIANLYAETTAASTGSLSVSNNAYINSSGNWVYRVNGKASNAYQYDGGYGFRTAGTGSSGGTISWTERFSIDSSGRVRKPNQPSFFSRPAGGYNLSSGGNTIAGTWSNVHNIGSHFSNGTFTAPVAGTYQFSWSVFSESETTRLDAYILVNGTVVMREEINGYPNTASNKNGSVHGCYYLSANDNVTFGVYTAAGNRIYVAAAPWTYACGFLLG